MQMSESFIGIGMALVNIKLWEWVSIFLFAHAYTTILLFFYSKSLPFAEASLIAYYITMILISWSK